MGEREGRVRGQSAFSKILFALGLGSLVQQYAMLRYSSHIFHKHTVVNAEPRCENSDGHAHRHPHYTQSC